MHVRAMECYKRWAPRQVFLDMLGGIKRVHLPPPVLSANFGDNLIDINIAALLAEAGVESVPEEALADPGVWIAATGGGNFGSRYWGFFAGRTLPLLERWPRNPFILFPNTWQVVPGEEGAFRRLILGREHRLFFRDRGSVAAAAGFSGARYAPDMAFLRTDAMDKLIDGVDFAAGRGKLYMRRLDREFEVSLIDGSFRTVTDYSRHFTRAAGMAEREENLRRAAALIGGYGHVVTERMHFGILAMLAGVETTFVRSTGGKAEATVGAYLGAAPWV